MLRNRCSGLREAACLFPNLVTSASPSIVTFYHIPILRRLALLQTATSTGSAHAFSGAPSRFSRYAVACARDGLHRRRAKGLQGPVADAAAQRGRAEVQDVPLRTGPDVSRCGTG